MLLRLLGHSLVVVALLCVSQLALADSVLPSDRVVNQLNVRAEPGRSSGIIASLRPGESAELLGSEPHWYHVRLDSGVEGYVSKSWARLVPDGPTPAAGGGRLEVHFIDVGQGDSTLVVCPDGQTILVDAGSTSGASPDPIRDYVLGVLDRRERRIDALVITHPDNDHFNLIPEVLRGVAIGHVYRVGELDDYNNAEFRRWLRNLDRNRVTVLRRDDHDRVDQPNRRMDCGDADVWILAAAVRARRSWKNAMSIVLMIRYGDFEVVLTGDATHATESAIMERYPESWLDSDVLKVGHHGSLATSTSERWASVIEPEVAVVSAAHTNGYGHPRREVIERLDDFTVQRDPHPMRFATREGGRYDFTTVEGYREAIYSTAVNGNVVIVSDGSGYEVTFGPFEE